MPVTNYFLQQENGSYILQEDSSKFIIESFSCPDAPTASLVQTCGVLSGSILVTSPISASYYEYSLNGTTYQTSPTFSNLGYATYSVYVRDSSSGCVADATASVRYNPPPGAPSLTVSQPTCAVATGYAVFNKPSASGYSYSLVSDPSSTYPLTTNELGLFTNLPASTNYLSYRTDTITGCTSSITPFVVNAAPAPFTSSVGPVTSSILTSLTASIYQGQTASFSLGTVTGASYYQWTPGNLAGNYTLTGSNVGTVTPIINLTGSVVNTSTLTVTPINVCAASSSTALITVNAIPVPIGIVTPVTYTQNDPSVPLIATASLTGSSLLWYTTGSGGVGTPTAPTPSTSIAGTQTYYVTTFLNGYESSPRTQIQVTVSSAPTPIPTTTPSPTQTPIPTSTPTPTVTGTPTPTSTNTPTPTPSPTQTPIPTSTPVPTGTPTPSPTQTPIPTSTPVPTGTPTPSPTVTPTPTVAPISPATTAVPYNLGLTAETTIYVNEVKCRVLENDFNYSQNPTVFKYITRITGSAALPFYSSSVGIITDGTITDNLTGSAFNPYVTTVGLYNEVNELLVVGKLATPYPIPENTDITFIVRWDS